jgi:hypothetical protein
MMSFLKEHKKDITKRQENIIFDIQTACEVKR